MRILVTGGAGFIGSAVARLLVRESEHDVLVVDKLTYAGNLESLAPIEHNKRFTFLKADIGDRVAMRAAFASFRPDIVMHLAAESHVDRSIDTPGDFIQTNVVGTYTLLETAVAWLRELGADAARRFRFHHISTDEVFGSLGATGAFREDTGYAPRSPYSASKAASDHLVRAWAETYGLPVVVSNCSNNYGPYQFPEKLIPLMILNAMKGANLPVYGKGENVRDWIFVDDHARGLVEVALRGRVGETYLLGARAEMRNIDVVHAICAVLDRLAPDAQGRPHARLIQFVTDRPGHDHRYAIDCAKAEQELGWRPRGTFDTHLETTARWYLDNKPWWQRIHSGAYRGERLGSWHGERMTGRALDIALFGAGGQLGSAIYDLAQPCGGSLSAWSHTDCDITDKAAVANALQAARPAVVINAAAYTAVDRAESDQARAFAVNHDGAANLAAAAKSIGASFIHVSTDYVFDGAKIGPYVEADPIAPLGIYGRSKAEGERAVLEIMPVNAAILRTAWVYGLQGANFVKTMLRLGAERDLVRVVDDQRGSPTFACDLAAAVLDLALKLKPARSRIYHAAGQGKATWHEFACEIFAETARRGLKTPKLEAITTAQYPTPAKRPANSVLDCSLLERDFGIKLPHWRDGLHRMLTAHLEGVP